jgi:mannose-1-phosphate guanylyltransferase
MQALILAGGEGTRLRPLTSTLPKPVLPLANRPFISYMIDWLVEHGVSEIVMSCGFLASEVRSVLGDGAGTGVRLSYVEEPRPLGTAGAVKHAEDLLGDRFFVLNGDILADFDLSALVRFHADHGAAATIALIPVEDPSAYGLVRTDDSGAIGQFLEKPSPEEIDTNLINAGAYVLEHRVLDAIPAEEAVSFEREVFPSLIGDGLFGRSVSGYWLDIGTPERYLEATRDILRGTVHTSVGERLSQGSVDIGAQTAVDPGARVSGPTLVGSACELAGGCRLGPLSVLGDGCVVGAGALVDGSVLHPRVEVEDGATLRDSIVGTGARIGADSTVEGTIIGPGATIGAGTVLTGERVEADGAL